MASYRDRLPVAGGGGAVIKSVQRGFVSIPSRSTSIDVSINPLDTSKSFLTFTYSVSGTSSDTPNNSMCSGVISGSNKLTFSRFSAPTSTVDIEWEVVEYISGAVVQIGSSAFTGVSLSVPISRVNLDKSFLLVSMTSSADFERTYQVRPMCSLSSETSISFVRAIDYGPVTIKWQVVTYV